MKLLSLDEILNKCPLFTSEGSTRTGTMVCSDRDLNSLSRNISVHSSLVPLQLYSGGGASKLFMCISCMPIKRKGYNVISY